MSESVPSYWTPGVLDVQAQAEDRKLFSVLHQATAHAVEPIFRARLQGFAAEGLANGFIGEAELLRQFLVDEPSAKLDFEAEAGTATGLREQLALYLQARVSQRTLTTADIALAKQLSEEFAGAAWATIISLLNRQRGKDGVVAPLELLPVDLRRGNTALLLQVCADARHFELACDEINQVMASTLTTLLENGTEKYLRLPRGLRIERQALRVHVLQAKERDRADSGTILYTAVNLDFSTRTLQEMHRNSVARSQAQD
jgi:hypothetical protein